MDERTLSMVKTLASDLDGIRANLKLMQKAVKEDLVARALNEHIAMLEVDVHMATTIAEAIAPADEKPVLNKKAA